MSETPEVLLAKSTGNPANPEPGTRLDEHLILASRIARQIIANINSDLRRWLRLSNEDFRTFVLAATMATGLHDLGKANLEFQQLLRGKLLHRQTLRHEVWSLLGLLGIYSDWWHLHFRDRWAAAMLAGIVAHHLKATYAIVSPGKYAAVNITQFWSRPEVERAFRTLCELSDLSPPRFDRHRMLTGEEIDDILLEYTRSADRNRWSNAADGRRFAAIRAIVVAADRLSSAHLHEASLEDFAQTALSRVLEKRAADDIVQAALGGDILRPFQESVGASTARVTLVRAGCGNGKTVAAYHWARRHAVGRKLFVCYPTTGTATEGFRDYLQVSSELGAILDHSRADVDVDAVFMTGEEEETDEPVVARMEILNRWAAPVVACTVDRVLGLLQNYKGSLTFSPSILSGAIVFDEIHMYDSLLFGNLLTFLRELDHIPVLLMTASLPEAMARAIQAACGEDLSPIIYGEESIEIALRYRLAESDPEVALIAAVKEYEKGGRVLWVTNTVSSCRRTAARLKKEYNIESLIYHSRYKYTDRVDRHNDVIRSFKKGFAEGEAVFAITTQVCEVSLDISATLLVSELCPFASLIQRLGRLSRPGQDSTERAQALILKFQGKPYEPEELQIAHKLIRHLAGKPIAQNDLAIALETVEIEEPEPIASAWMDTGWEAETQPIRTGGYTIDVILESDAEQLRQSPQPWKHTARFKIPMPHRAGLKWDRGLGVHVVPDEDVGYDSLTGCEWRKTTSTFSTRKQRA